MATTQLPIAPHATRFLDSPKRLLIGNEWVDSSSGKTFPVYNPATGDEIARVAEGGRRISTAQ